MLPVEVALVAGKYHQGVLIQPFLPQRGKHPARVVPVEPVPGRPVVCGRIGIGAIVIQLQVKRLFSRVILQIFNCLIREKINDMPVFYLIGSVVIDDGVIPEINRVTIGKRNPVLIAYGCLPGLA